MRYGREVLEVEISHLLLQQSLAKANLTVADQDLNDEIAHARRAGRRRRQRWQAGHRQVVQDGHARAGHHERSIHARLGLAVGRAQEAHRRHRSKSATTTCKKGFEANYGERVRCRAIVLANMRRAQEVWAKARAESRRSTTSATWPKNTRSSRSSKSLRGEVPPIRKFGGQPQLEDVAFDLEAGRAVGHHPVGRQVRDPEMRRPHAAGRGQSAGSPRRSVAGHLRERSCGWR